MNFSKSILNTLACVAIVFTASCANEKTVTTKKARATSGLDKYNSNYEYTKDKNGLMRATSNKQSQFSRGKQFAGTRDYSGKDYNKKDYRTKRWGQKSDYSAQQYQGKRDSNYGNSPYYVNQARIANRDSRYSNNNYGTGSYKAGNAHEGTGSRRNSNVSKGASGYVSSQGKYPQPLIMSKDQYTKINQQKQLTVRQSNSMLGR